MNYELTQHARDVLEEREIRIEWLDKALANPELVEHDATDPKLENRFATIVDFGNRVLRVVVNTRVVPERVVSVYFDRRMKGKV